MTVDEYVQNVMRRIPRSSPARSRIEADLREHLREGIDAGKSDAEAMRQVGEPEDVARAFVGDFDRRYASFMDRTGAFLVDIGLGVTLSFLIFLLGPERFLADAQVAIMIGFAFLALVPTVLYFPALETIYGQTLGKRLFGICVTRTSGLRVSFPRALVRRVPLFFEFFMLDAIVAAFTEKRQRAFDFVGDTVVVRCDDARHPALGWALAALLLAPPFVWMIYTFQGL